MMRLPRLPPAYAAEARTVMSIAWAIQATNLLDFGLSLSTLVIVGHGGDKSGSGSEWLAAAALGNLYVNFSGMAPLMGMAGAIDTLSSQAIGAKAYGRVGQVSQRALMILLLIAAGVAAVWWYASVLFGLLGQDPLLVELATEYVRYFLPGLLPALVYEVLKRHLQVCGQVRPPAVITAIGITVNVCLGVWWVHFSPLGFVGAPLAISTSRWVMAACAAAYHRWHRAIDGALGGLCTGGSAGGGGGGSSADGAPTQPSSPVAALADAAPAEPGQPKGSRPRAPPPRLLRSTQSARAVYSQAAQGSTRALPLHAAGTGGGDDVVVEGADGRVQFATLAPTVEEPEDEASAAGAGFAIDDDHAVAAAAAAADGGSATGTTAASGDGAVAFAVAPASSEPGADVDVGDGADVVLGPHDLLQATWSRGLDVTAALSGWRVFLALGAPSALMLLCEWGSFEVQSVIAGLYSTPVLAAHTVLATTAGAAFMFTLGFSIAVGIRVGQRMGERNPDGARLAYRSTLGLGALFVAANAVFVLAVARVWGGVFTDDPEVRGLVATWLPLLVLFNAPDTVQGVANGTLRGLGFPGVAAAGNILSYVIIGLPTSYLLCVTAGLGLPGLWAGSILGFSVSAAFMATAARCVDWHKAAQTAHARATAGEPGSGDGGDASASDAATPPGGVKAAVVEQLP
jgi:Na+-driven multidrug efflux pump